MARCVREPALLMVGAAGVGGPGHFPDSTSADRARAQPRSMLRPSRLGTPQSQPSERCSAAVKAFHTRPQILPALDLLLELGRRPRIVNVRRFPGLLPPGPASPQC